MITRPNKQKGKKTKWKLLVSFPFHESKKENFFYFHFLGQIESGKSFSFVFCYWCLTTAWYILICILWDILRRPNRYKHRLIWVFFFCSLSFMLFGFFDVNNDRKKKRKMPKSPDGNVSMRKQCVAIFHTKKNILCSFFMRSIKEPSISV